jgi:hypothetical protein
VKIEKIICPNNKSADNYLDMAMLALGAPVIEAEEIPFKQISFPKVKKQEFETSITIFGLGAGITEFQTPLLEYKNPPQEIDILPGEKTKLISNKEEILSYDEKIKQTGWQFLKKRTFDAKFKKWPETFKIDIFSESGLIGRGDSGSALILPSGECVGVITTQMGGNTMLSSDLPYRKTTAVIKLKDYFI